MSEPRPHYALPYVDSELPEPTPTLWIGSCERCAGEGVVVLELEGADPNDRYTCRRCDGSGLEPNGEIQLRRLREP